MFKKALLNVPEELQKLDIWTTHINKRPAIAPNMWEAGLTFKEVIGKDAGVLIPPATVTDLVFVDVDFPLSKSTKNGRKALMDAMLANSQMELGDATHLEAMQPTLDMIRGTPIEALLTKTYVEYSPSLLGLRLILHAPDKGEYMKAVLKAITWSGQVSVYNQFITITGIKYPGSLDTIGTCNIRDLGLNARPWPVAPIQDAQVPMSDIEPTYNTNGQATSLSDMADVTPTIEEAIEVEVVQHTTNQAKAQALSTTLAAATVARLEADANDGIEVDFNDISLNELPKLTIIERTLHSLPMDRNVEFQYIYQRVTGEQYEHYAYWLMVGMALHSYGVAAGCNATMYKLYLIWSKRDEESFTGDADVLAKWVSFDTESHANANITWRTLLKLANTARFDYPVREMVRGKATRYPKNTEYKNFEYLINLFEIKLYEQNGYFVSAREDVLQRYFDNPNAAFRFKQIWGPFSRSQIQSAALIMCQDCDWRGLSNTRNIAQPWLDSADKELDWFQLWLDTPFSELPDEMRYRKDSHNRMFELQEDEESCLETIIECLNIQCDESEGPETLQLYHKMVKATLMQALKFRDTNSDFDGNGGMLILVGPENTYKSTFLKMLCPVGLQILRKEVNMQLKGEKSIRDFIRLLGHKFIVQLDEFEGLMDQDIAGSLFKNILSGNQMDYTEIYSNAETNVMRKSILVASTNERNLRLSDNGHRRMWIVPVGKIDTFRMQRVNMHTVFRKLREEYKKECTTGQFSWLLNNRELDTLASSSSSVTATTELGVLLPELWDFNCGFSPDYITKEYNSKNIPHPTARANSCMRLMTTRDVRRRLLAYCRFEGISTNIKTVALERELERLISSWLHTRTKAQVAKLINLPRSFVPHVKHIGRVQYSSQPFSWWIMPARIAAQFEAEDGEDINMVKEAEVLD